MSFTIRVKPRNVFIVLVVGAISALAATFTTIHWMSRLLDVMDEVGQ